MELPKAYEPAKYESDIYKLWEDSGAFKPSADPKAKPYSIIMPPPNANGNIHVGTAMFTLEDIMVRYHRMLGDATLWLPGTDHAGIETQVVFERELAKTGQDRFDYGPTKFYNAMMTYTKSKQATIISELKSLGFSADWSRLKFTLDPDVIKTVYATFKQLHDDRLIYRGNRIVNWCTRCQSSFADIEVKYQERDDSIFTLDYGPVRIATTRPETIFADAAVAVNPKDDRYQSLIGKTATVPLLNRPVPIIADQHVDLRFGTGALKVTPGHDPNDFDIGQRHGLPQISVIDLEGRMVNVPEELLGLTVEQARAKAVELLTQSTQLVKTKSIRHSVGTHGRCGTVIEPLITEQWWLKVAPLGKPAIQAIESGQIKLIPASSIKTAVSWLKGLHDWNISRQIWWGIKIPVYYQTSNDPRKKPYLITDNEAEALHYYGKNNYRAETDTFDTWFSSGQWPFATLGYPNSSDFKRFYPTTVMETGRDILFLWVTRMIMLGVYRTGRVPFKNVYLHGLVNDQYGKKMSKSRGNVINPLEFTKKYGTDALRLALTIGITPGNDGTLGEKKVEGYRNFCNKLWNASRYVLSQLPTTDYQVLPPIPLSLADKWILDKLSCAITRVSNHLDSYRFSDAGQTVYSLLWDDFADWYIEASKSEQNLPVLIYALTTILKLAHPFAPFVTEAIWQNIPWQKQNLITSAWPMAGPTHSLAAKQFEQLRLLITDIRNLKGELGLSDASLIHQGDKLITNNQLLISRLSGLKQFEVVKQGRGLALSRAANVSAWLDVDTQVLAAYLNQLRQKLTEQTQYRDNLKKQLSNRRFVASAPKSIVSDTRHRLATAEMLISKLDEQINAIKNS